MIDTWTFKILIIKKIMNIALLLIGMPIGSQLHILLQTCNDQRSKIHQNIWGKKRHEI